MSRPTRDVDLQAEEFRNDVEGIRLVVCDIADLGVDDGLVRLPAGFDEIVAAVILFAEPVISGNVGGLAWDPGVGAWR